MMLNRFAEVAVSHGGPKVIRPWDKVVMEEMTGLCPSPRYPRLSLITDLGCLYGPGHVTAGFS